MMANHGAWRGRTFVKVAIGNSSWVGKVVEEGEQWESEHVEIVEKKSIWWWHKVVVEWGNAPLLQVLW